jgi:GNAT superfamily N-acetyltransferase
VATVVDKSVQIEPVQTRQDLEDFIQFPFELYRGDPNWVPPLLSQRRHLLQAKHNPFFEHSDVALWLARRQGRVVGTISSHVDHLHNKVHEEKIGMFGFFETVHDYAVAEALLSTVRDWVRQQGMAALRGPLSFSQNDECGLLVDGFDGPPMVMMTYNPRYYIEFLERFGLTKAMNLYAYFGDLAQFGGDPANLPEKLVRVTDKVKARAGITLRLLDMKLFDEELEEAKKVYNKAWEKNWGFVPMTDAEFDKLGDDLKQVLDPRLALIAEIDGEPVGVVVAVPDANQVLKYLNGRLFPIGWIRALWYSRKVNQARLMILGVVEEHRGRGIESLLIFEMFKAAIQSGYQGMEMSWILETNDMMNRVIQNLGDAYGVQAYRTYRIYQIPV